uniref:Activin_recp domain-containing protein n=1 Tax=Heterorhabditis bacteriophora TaxID=37862 RepID=A0A1I7XIH2_HETBA
MLIVLLIFVSGSVSTMNNHLFTVYDEGITSGVRIRGYIRGCMNDVLINGFNQTIVNWYRWMHRDSCRPYRKKELFKLGGDMSDDSTIDVCTCYADYCNGNGVDIPSSLLDVVFAIILILRLT